MIQIMEKDAFVQILRNNGVANCDGCNREIISQIQQQCKSKLESSQRKLNEARALVKTLEEEVAAAERQNEFYMSASVPIRQVPVEVLSSIFVLACHWDAFHFYPRTTYGKKVQNHHTTGSSIIRVCKHWHDVALQSPAMWSHPFVFHDLRDDERMGEGVKYRLKAASAKCRGRPIPHVYFQNLGHPRALQQLNESLPWDLITCFSLTRTCRYYLWFDILQSLPNLTYLHINGAKVTSSVADDEDTLKAMVPLNKLRVLEVHDDGLVFLQPGQRGPFKSMLSRVNAPVLETFDLIVTTEDRTFERLRGASQTVTEFLSRSPALRRIRVWICMPTVVDSDRLQYEPVAQVRTEIHRRQGLHRSSRR
ncbi:hypothetical protein FA13DRAFT_1126104 [Coprinellus micaceus]|uniref:Uncharacterized protein n=1 Tax=Coprinellus micaceus TaxID=71717 RepID=A0A4Y7SWK8_COPMI|nr:hypothetical protein FA13DRAFT_1126104 [Coprinellus micaceus]